MTMTIASTLAASERLDALFRPSSVAILGASRSPAKFGHVLLKSLLDHGYTGAIYPINPVADDILGLRCYPDAASVPTRCDLVVIALPAAQVPAAFEEWARHGAGAAIIITSGFAEIGGEGLALEERLLAASRRYGVPFVGPNCQGVVDTSTPLYAVMAGAMYNDPVPATTGVSIISHSGGYTGYCFRECANHGIGIAKAISSGNEAVLGLADFLEVLAEDDATRVILLHLEGVTEARRFRAAASRLASAKPIVINHVGRTPAAALAATTHTAHLAAPGRVLRAFYRQCGAVVTNDQEAAVDAAAILAVAPAPRGKGVAVVSFSGGMRVEFADLLTEQGFTLPSLSAETEARLAAIIPAHGSVKNPIDMADGLLVDPDCPAKSMRAVADDPAVDIVVVLLTITRNPAVARGIIAARNAITKPVVVLCSAQAYSQAAVTALKEAGIPVYPSTRRAMNALDALDQRRQVLASTRSLDLGTDDLPVDSNGQVTVLSSAAAFTMLEAQGVQCAPWRSFDAATPIAGEALSGLNFPLAVKFDSAELPHKTEAGAVVLGCANAAAVESARRQVTAGARAFLPGVGGGVLVQEMASGVAELIIGFHRDPVVGPVAVIGLGGIMVELFDDVAMRVLPTPSADFREMLAELRGFALLNGYRGRPAADVDALVKLIEKAANFFASRPELVSMEMNPVIVRENGLSVVDVLICATSDDHQST